MTTPPVDGYYPTRVYYKISIPNIPDTVGEDLDILLPVLGFHAADKETYIAALEAGMDAIVSYLNTEEPSWGAARAGTRYDGTITTVPS